MGGGSKDPSKLSRVLDLFLTIEPVAQPAERSTTLVLVRIQPGSYFFNVSFIDAF